MSEDEIGWEDSADELDYWNADDPGDRPPCGVDGCRRAGIVIIFRGRSQEDPQMTMSRFCPEHLTQLFDLSGATIRVRPGVPLTCVLPPPPPGAN